MFNGIKPRTFLSTPQEWHALVIGFCEVLCLWKPHIPCHLSSDEAISQKGGNHDQS